MNLDVNPSLPPTNPFQADVIAGLDDSPRSIPCKYFYDDRGSKLFHEICRLDEYYLTRTELEITRTRAAEIAALIGSRACLVELGAGDGQKTRRLLKHLLDPAAYIPVDICAAELNRCVNALRAEYEDLEISPVLADYTEDWSLPRITAGGQKAFYFPGSTIGNFTPPEAHKFLGDLSHLAGPRGSLLVGVDLHKDRAIIEAAYNDEKQVTAAFNLNLLRRINDECDANFDLSRFRHRAVYDEDHRRVEMRLISTCDQIVRVGPRTFAFDEGEFIITEYSHKFAIEDFAALAEESGWRTRAFWTDEDHLFSLWYLETSSLH